MASVVGEREVDLSKLSLEQLNQLKTQLSEVRALRPPAWGVRIRPIPARIVARPRAPHDPATTTHHNKYIYRRWRT